MDTQCFMFNDLNSELITINFSGWIREGHHERQERNSDKSFAQSDGTEERKTGKIFFEKYFLLKRLNQESKGVFNFVWNA